MTNNELRRPFKHDATLCQDSEARGVAVRAACCTLVTPSNPPRFFYISESRQPSGRIELFACANRQGPTREIAHSTTPSKTP